MTPPPLHTRVAVAVGVAVGMLATYAAYLGGVFAADLVGMAVAVFTFLSLRGAR